VRDSKRRRVRNDCTCGVRDDPVAVNVAPGLSLRNDNCTDVYCIPRVNLVIYARFRFGSRVGTSPWVELKCWTSGYPRILRTNEKGNIHEECNDP